VTSAKGNKNADAKATADAVARLYPEIYLLLHRRTGAPVERLTPQSQALLQHLTFSGPLTVGELAQHLGRAQSVVSETVDALEQRDLVGRVRDERDRRRTLVWLTPEAQDLLARLREVLDRQRLATAVGEMTSGERRALVEGLTALVRAAERARHRKEPKP
jgi:DNA-binding MarR family transcriptional regulator